jgi:hypothetical protein
VARKSAVDTVKSEADRYAANVLPIIREVQKAGARTLREIAEALSARGIATARWGPVVCAIGREHVASLVTFGGAAGKPGRSSRP